MQHSAQYDDAKEADERYDDDDAVEAEASQNAGVHGNSAEQLLLPSRRHDSSCGSVRVSVAEVIENADRANVGAGGEVEVDAIHEPGAHDAGASDAECAKADTIAGDTEWSALRGDLQCYFVQMNTIPALVAVIGGSDCNDGARLHALLGVRTWSERLETMRVGSTAGCERDSISVPMQVAVDKSALFRVIPFRDGVYRGQVAEAALRVGGDGIPSQLDADRDETVPTHDDSLLAFVPHGVGVWTSADGSCRCGQWVRGEQTGMGTQQHRGILMYEGEWKSDYPTGVGVGVFADGSSFAGEWVYGRPYGLGSLRTVGERAAATAEKVYTCFGWFHGMQCLQRCTQSVDHDGSNEGDEKKAAGSVSRKTRVAVPSRFEDQPLRGLYIASMRLEAWRVAKFQRVIDQWRFVCCQQAVVSARRSRQLAMIAWQEAHAAQQKAVDEHIAESIEQRKRDDNGLVQLTLKSREEHARVVRMREYHEQRRATAEFQCELARCCVDTQQDTVDLMESELSAIVKLLQEAKQAQADCSQHSHQLQLIKRQAENVSLKINDIRLRQERERLSAVKGAQSEQSQSRPTTTLSSLPGTPIGTAFAKLNSSGALQAQPASTVRDGGNQTESNVVLINPDYVCDVPGCDCGIPRDVFMRVGAALNGES